jgi:LysM repeat protein
MLSQVAISTPILLEEPVSEDIQPRAAGAGEMAVLVRSGESLVLISRWSGLSVEAIASRNTLEVSAPVYPGQSLILELGEYESDGFASARQSFQDDRLERYLDRHGGLVGVSPHVVETGETAWRVAKDNDLPIWVLSAFNSEADLDRLGIGAKLYVPVVGSSVAMNEMGEAEGWEVVQNDASSEEAVASNESPTDAEDSDEGVNIDAEIAQLDALNFETPVELQLDLSEGE